VSERPIFTPEHVARLQEVMRVWLDIRRANGYDQPPALVDMEKSRLLGRMLIHGKDPLPTPPPIQYGAGWYDLIDNGRAVWAMDDPGFGADGSVVICGGGGWRVLTLVDLDDFVLTHERTGDQRWKLTRGYAPCLMRNVPAGGWVEATTLGGWKLERLR
jgi:hypothetical protein